MGLKLVDTTATRRFVRGQDEDWIKGKTDEATGAVEFVPHPDAAGDDSTWVECRTRLSKAEDSTINDATVSERILNADGRMSLKPPKQGAVDPAVFRLMVVGWDLGDVKVETYERLDAGDAEWVDACIRRAIDEARAATQGNSTSPGKADQPSASPNSSDAEGDPNSTS